MLSSVVSQTPAKPSPFPPVSLGPESSIQKPSDTQVRVHTNVEVVVPPKAGEPVDTIGVRPKPTVDPLPTKVKSNAIIYRPVHKVVMNPPVSNISPSTTHRVAPKLPTPHVNQNAPPIYFIRVAKLAIINGHYGEAQEAIERAESRALNDHVYDNLRSPVRTSVPLMTQLSQVLQLLGSHRNSEALQKLNEIPD